MTIAFQCACGRTLRVKPELAGKKAKCPGCGEVLTIPAAGMDASAAAPKAAAKPAAAAATAPVVACTCGKRIATKPEWAGKVIKCPGCGERIKVPGAAAVAAPTRPAPPRRPAPPPPPMDDDATEEMGEGFGAGGFGDDDDVPTPTRGKAGRPAPVKKGGGRKVLFAVLVLLLLAGAGAAAYFAFLYDPRPNIGPIVRNPESKKNTPEPDNKAETDPDDPAKTDPEKKGETNPDLKTKKATPVSAPSAALEWVSAKGTAFVAIRLGDFMNTPGGQKLLKRVRAMPDNKLEMLDKLSGLEVENLREIIAVMAEPPAGDAPPDKGYLIVSTSKPADMEKIEKTAEEMMAVKKEINGKVAWVIEADPKKPTFHLVTPELAIFGPEDVLTPLLTEPVSKEGPLAAAIAAASGDRSQIFAGFVIPAEVAAMGREKLEGPLEGVKPLLEASEGSLTVHSDKALQVLAKLKFPDPEKAEEAKKAVDGLLGFAGLMLPGMKQKLDPAQMKTYQLAEAALKSIRPTVAGDTVSIPVKVDASLDELVEKALEAMVLKKGAPSLEPPPVTIEKKETLEKKIPEKKELPEEKDIPEKKSEKKDLPEEKVEKKAVPEKKDDKLPAGLSVELPGLKLDALPTLPKREAPAGLALPEAFSASELTPRPKEGRNLRKLALAMHAFEAKNRTLPAAKLGDSLSWRVAILPFLDEPKLFAEFKTEEPWDGEGNKKLLERMPKLFEHPNRPAPLGHTYYRIVTGPKTIFPDGKALSVARIADGSGQTLLIVEARDAVPWTKSDELTLEADGPLPKLGDAAKGGDFLAAFADASVAIVRSEDADLLRAALTAMGGEKMNLRKLVKPVEAVAEGPVDPSVPPGALNWISADSMGFARIRVADLLKMPGGKDLVTGVELVNLGTGTGAFLEAIGLTPEDLLEVAYTVYQSGNEPSFLGIGHLVVTTSKAIDPEKLGKAAKDIGGAAVDAGRPVYSFEKAGGALCLLAPKVLLVGPTKYVRDFSGVKDHNEDIGEGTLAKAWEAAATDTSTFFVGLQPPKHYADEIRKSMSPGAAGVMDLFAMSRGQLSLTADKTLTGELTFPDAAKAQQAAKSLESLVGAARSALDTIKPKLTPATEKAFPALEAAIKSVEVKLEDETIRIMAKLDVPLAEIAGFSALIEQLNEALPKME